MKTFRYQQASSHQEAFSFLELIIVIAILGIMASLAVTNFANSASDAREVLGRQQQAAIQTAVNAWVADQTSSPVGFDVDGDDSDDYYRPLSVAEARDLYNNKAADTPRTSEERLTLVSGYLDDSSYSHFATQSALEASTEVMSEAIRKLNWHIALPEWQPGSYPKVNLNRTAASADDDE